MPKHIINNWFYYVGGSVVALLGYYFIAPVISSGDIAVSQTSEIAVMTEHDPSEDLFDEPEDEITDETETVEEVAAVVEPIVVLPAVPDPEPVEETIEEEITNEITMDEYTTTDSGLQYKVITEGNGGPKPEAHSQVTVHYHGTLSDGTVFDSSRERGETISFGLNQVISGWTEGLQLMSVGDVFEFNIPADLAYGDRSPSPLIPAGSNLIFQVELFEIK